jgi:hypothetical protein
MISFDPIVAVLLGDVCSSGDEFVVDPQVWAALSVVTSTGAGP